MTRGFLMSLIAVAVFALSSIVGADSRLLSNTEGLSGQAAKDLARHRTAMAISARSYRSPGVLRKVVIDSNDNDAISGVIAGGGIEISDYGSFKLFVMDATALERETERLARTGALGSGDLSGLTVSASNRLAIRDDFNVVLLRSGAIDTSDASAPGRFLGLGRGLVAAAPANVAGTAKGGRASLRLLQFVGPVKSEWLAALRTSGLEPIVYIPNNAYLVRGTDGAAASLMNAASGEQFVQWQAPFEDQYKVEPSLIVAMQRQPDVQIDVAVQIAHGAAMRTDDVKTVKHLASRVLLDAHSIMNFTNLRVTVSAGKIAELAALPNVVNIEAWNAPWLADERSAQILAGQLASDARGPTGPGYSTWLQAHGFTSKFNFAIDVADSGIDRGATTADKLHPDFLDADHQSRVLYARDYTSEQDPADVDGHGTINASIAAGGSISAATGMRDADGYNFGLGTAPFALLGASKIFQSTGRFDLVDPFSTLISNAYIAGARISSNSWGNNANAYTIDSQEYDLRVRDAVPTQPGNQELSISFAAGNAGDTQRVGAPSTAKNVISVAASESSRKDGTDGCGVDNSDSDNATEMAFFSSGGPLFDGRIKPDITAPGTHIQGAASQNPSFDGTGVCGADLGAPFFPANQTLYTWSSGTSHSTPQVAGAAALARQFFLNRGDDPSAALIKALLLATPTYLTGTGAGGDLPHHRQGWGLLDLGRAFDTVPKIFVNQSTTFGDTGQDFIFTGEVKDPTQPFRVTLAWTDAPGFSGAAPWVNDLDLEVTINGQVYRGNNFAGQESQPGGTADTRNNVEAVWLPAGTVGSFIVHVRASNIAGDGVPGNADPTDQDFALVVYNGERKDAPVASIANVMLAGGADVYADPGESVTMRVSVGDLSTVALTAGHGVLTSKTTGVTVTANAADFPNVTTGQSAEGLTPFTFTIDKTIACGAVIQFVLDVASGGVVSRVPFSVRVGHATAVELFADDIEAGDAKWTHGSLGKKKKKKTGLDTWALSTRRAHSGTNSWFSADPETVADTALSTAALALPADGKDLQLTFFHTFEFEPGAFDGAVIEISSGGDFEDLGPKIIKGGYTGAVWEFSSAALAGKPAWVEGRLGQFEQVVVDLSSYAGKTVTIRFHFSSDTTGKALGWYIDDVALRGTKVTCTPANQ